MKYVWVLAVVLLLLVFATREHMTNKDLISTLKTFGEKGTPPSKKADPNEAYGPRAPIVDHSTAKKPSKGTVGGEYPEIFGPEYVGAPGTKPNPGKTDNNDVYTFNPDLQKAFPSSGEPAPFLTDFSKFLH
jgi:hypothetical protein